jgi:predicted ArsR family transcriptional regulator
MMKPTFRTFEFTKCRDILSLIAASNGDAQNASEIGRQLGISYHAVYRRLDTLESLGMIRVLHSTGSRRPHVQLRDCRLLQEDCPRDRLHAGRPEG